MTLAKLLDESDDWVLLDKVARRDHDAFQEIFIRYKKIVFAFILKNLEHKQSAEDACQDVFTRLWEKASSFEKRDAKFSTLLIGIAYKVVQEYWRAEKKKKEKLRQVKREHIEVQPQPVTIDRYFDQALDELRNPRNYRKGQPTPSLAFHLAVCLRRYAGIRPKKRLEIRQESNVQKGPAVVRRYLWLRLWASGKRSFS